MIFRKRRKRNRAIENLLRNENIFFQESTQFLGVTLDSILNMEEHINNLKAKAKTALNTIKVVAGKKWGGDRKTLKKLYSEICRTKIDYGCQIYNTASAGRTKK